MANNDGEKSKVKGAYVVGGIMTILAAGAWVWANEIADPSSPSRRNAERSRIAESIRNMRSTGARKANAALERRRK